MTDRPLATTYPDLFDGDDAGVELLIGDLDALYTAPLPLANMQARFDHLLRQRAQTVANGRVTPVAGAIPPLSRGALPVAHPEPIPLPDRTGPRARLRQIVGIAGALFVFVLVAIMLSQLFGAGRNDNQQAAPVDPKPSTDVGEILFVGEDEAGTRAIYLARADGSGVTQITPGTPGKNDYEPVWSPDGTQIAFSSDAEGQFNLYVMDADGDNRRHVADGSMPAMTPAWSPDGTQLAFSRFEADRFEIVVVNVDGTGLRNLTNGDGGMYPAWSPDGARIAFIGYQDDGRQNISVIDADGGRLRHVATEWEYVFGHSWSPDGSRIAFMGFSDEAGEIVVLNANDFSSTRLPNRGFYGPPAWSPDGRELVVTYAPNLDDDDPRIYVVSADGSNQRLLIDAAGRAPAWSPDGSMVAFVSGEFTGPPSTPTSTFTLHVVDRDGTNHRVLAENVFAIAPYIAWRPDPSQSSTAEAMPPPGPTPTPAPPLTPIDDLAKLASRSPFPDAEVLHVVQIAEQRGQYTETLTTEVWIDQTTGDAMVWQTTMDGEPRSLIDRQGTTVIKADAGIDGWTSVSITTMLSIDDPNLPDPLGHLNRFRNGVMLGFDELEALDITVRPNSSHDGQPVVEMVVPIRDGGQVIGTVSAYLDPGTLYPVAVIGDHFEEVFSYPTIEPLTHADVPAGTFNPPIPDAPITFIREAIAPEALSDFDAYPLWWLGDEFSGYELQSIERYRVSSPDDDPDDEDTVTALCLGGPDDFDDQLQVISEPPLSDIDWAHRDANHNVHNYEELEIDGNRAWLHPDGSQIEIAFPDSYVTISAPNLALAAAEALQQANAPVDISEAAIAAAVAALPEDERGCGATPVGIREDTGRGNQVQGRTVIGDPESIVLLMQYSTLDGDSPRVIRVGQSVLSYWVVDGQSGPLNLVSLVNLDTGLSLRPDSGPIEGQGPWRPVVWRTIITFPEPGCWQVVVTRGDGAGVIWLDVQPSMDALATPVTTVEQFTSAVAPLTPGSGRQISFTISADYRMDEGGLHDWTVTLWDRTNDAGRQQRRMIAYDSDGNIVAWFTRDGDVWQWWQRGWGEMGTMSSGVVELPVELRMVNASLEMLLTPFRQGSGYEIIQQRQEGDTSVTRYEQPYAAELSRQFGRTIVGGYHEVWVDANGVPIRVRWVIQTDDGYDFLLADALIQSDALLRADSLDDALFELPGVAMVSHRYWGWGTLPRDLGIELADTQLGGPPTGGELHAITGDGIDLQLEVFPSSGGNDWRMLSTSARRWDGLIPTVTNSRAGSVTWLVRPGDGWPIRAVWDDGAYRFDLQGDLRDWTEADLIALVEALSAGALR